MEEKWYQSSNSLHWLGFHWSNMLTLTQTTTIPFFLDNSIWSTFTFTLKYCQNRFNKVEISLVVYIIPAWPNGYSGWLTAGTLTIALTRRREFEPTTGHTCGRHCFFLRKTTKSETSKNRQNYIFSKISKITLRGTALVYILSSCEVSSTHSEQ